MALESASHAISIEHSLVLVYGGAAILGTIALIARQVLPVVYIFLGALIGPGGFKLIPDLAIVDELANIGIIFLLFLLGMDLYPQKTAQDFSVCDCSYCGNLCNFLWIGVCSRLSLWFHHCRGSCDRCRDGSFQHNYWNKTVTNDSFASSAYRRVNDRRLIAAGPACDHGVDRHRGTWTTRRIWIDCASAACYSSVLHLAGLSA